MSVVEIIYLCYIQSQYIKNYLKNHKYHFTDLYVVAWHDKSAACGAESPVIRSLSKLLISGLFKIRGRCIEKRKASYFMP